MGENPQIIPAKIIAKIPFVEEVKLRLPYRFQTVKERFQKIHAIIIS
jgi:hypothetical protein